MFFIGLKPDINIVYSCQSLARYSHFCCWDFTDVTLAYEDGNLMSVDGLTCVRLVTPIWWLNYGQDFWSQILVKILRQPFGQILEGEVCSSFWGWNLVEILRLKFGWDLKAEVWSTFWGKSLVEILNLKFDLKAVTLVKTLNPWVRCASWQSIYNLALYFIGGLMRTGHLDKYVPPQQKTSCPTSPKCATWSRTRWSPGAPSFFIASPAYPGGGGRCKHLKLLFLFFMVWKSFFTYYHRQVI